MSKSWSRAETWVAAIGLLVSVLITVILGLPAFMKAITTPLHPDPKRAPSVAGSDRSRDWTPSVERARAVLRGGLSQQNLPGLSVAVGKGGEIVWAEGFGWADVDKQVPVSPKHRFRIGTASQALTSAAVGLLLEQGKLSLDGEIQKSVPEFPKQPQPVTLRQLMGHVSGVRNDGGDEGPLFVEHCKRPVEALEAFADRGLLFEPGTRFHPSSYGWIVVSAAVESAAREPFLAYMRKQVFEPLGMRDTLPDSATETIPDEVTSYFPRFAADPRYGLHLTRDLDLSCYAGASVFLSTPSDLVRFGLAIQGGTLLKPATVQLLQASQKLASGKETGYGLGWDLETVALGGEHAAAVGHDGDILGGPVASLLVLPERGLVVAVTSNISYAGTFPLATKVAEAFVSARP